MSNETKLEDAFGTYWLDDDGNKTYERTDMCGNKYEEDEGGHKTYIRDGYREDENGNRTYFESGLWGLTYTRNEDGSKTTYGEFFGHQVRTTDSSDKPQELEPSALEETVSEESAQTTQYVERIDSSYEQQLWQQEEEEETAQLVNKHGQYKLFFEPRSRIEESAEEMMTFDESLNRLKSEGYERHPKPYEIFSLLIKDLEGTLNASLIPLVKTFHGFEWMNLAVERKIRNNYELLILYIDPEGLAWDVNTYVKTNDFRFSDKLEFLIDNSSIVKLSRSDFLPLCLMNDNLATYLYSRHFDELPEVFKTMGQEEKGLLLPKNHNKCLPIRRDVYELGCPYKKGISWGVKT